MDDPNITMEEYIRLEEEEARRLGKVYNLGTTTYDKIWDNEDVHNLRSIETEFLAIVFDNFINLSTLHFLKVPKNSLEVLKVLENSLEVLKVLKNNLESLKLQEN
ncbi:hypothetical protein Tco_1478910 [Tanacetum coccineum]